MSLGVAQDLDAADAEASGAALRAALSASFAEGGGDEAVKALLAKALSKGRMAARARLEAGDNGFDVARQLCRATDQIVGALYDYASIHLFRARNPTEGERMAVVAVGGFGRGELAPFSDLDLLFLRAYKQTPFVESVTEYMLYTLWDLGLTVGQSSRTIDDCLKLAREDHTIQTALLDARWLAGDKALADTLAVRFRKEVANKNQGDYIAAKLRERDERHARIGATRYMVEPNLKEGKGGLRDLHTLFWMARMRYGFTSPRDYIKAGVFTRDDFATFRRSLLFLWTVRCHLHFLTERAEERLTFDVQPELARRMGFKARGGQSAVERFMKRYFLTAREVGVLTRVLCAKLERDHSKLMPVGLRRFLPSQLLSGGPPAPGFHIEGGRLDLDSPAVLDDHANLIRVFEIAAARDLDIHPHAFDAVSRRVRSLGAKWRDDAASREAFLRIIDAPRQPGAILRLMNDAGVLGRFVPEFGAIVAQMQFNMYHHYTVDEHTLQAIDAIAEIEQGRHKGQHPLATSIFPKIINRRALYLAMLLHDTGKGSGDQQVEGEKTARAACARLGLQGEEVDLVGWLVRHHLLMSDTAQKRDIGDPRTVAQFAKVVGNVERLRLLLVLTVADMRAVGPSLWNDWKGQLLRDLYRLTEAAMRGGRSGEDEVRAHLSELAGEAKAALLAGMPGPHSAEIEDWLTSLEDGYWLSHDADALAWHAREMDRVEDASAGPHVALRVRPEHGVTEVLVYAADRPGLFASLAAAISAFGANIAGARVYTTRDGAAFDVFALQTTNREPFCQGSPASLRTLSERLKRAALEDAAAPAAPAPTRRHAAFVIEPWVRIDNEATPNATVIEASGRDRVGLLADLARVCADLGVSIVSAHIDTAGERASDVFYVQNDQGAPIADQQLLEALRARFVAELRMMEPEAGFAVSAASTAR